MSIKDKIDYIEILFGLNIYIILVFVTQVFNRIAIKFQLNH